MKRVLLLTLCLLPAGLTAEIYRWTDENGRVRYSDSARANPKPDAEKIEVEVQNTYKSVPIELPEYMKNAGKDDAGLETITMYATAWCKYCKKARDYFAANNIAYTEYDIEKDPSAKLRYEKAGGTGVPVIMYKGNKLQGFSVSSFKAFIERNS